MPPGQYPHGYNVDVRGAQVTSSANAPVLELTSAAGSEVRVMITPEN